MELRLCNPSGSVAAGRQMAPSLANEAHLGSVPLQELLLIGTDLLEETKALLLGCKSQGGRRGQEPGARLSLPGAGRNEGQMSLVKVIWLSPSGTE